MNIAWRCCRWASRNWSAAGTQVLVEAGAGIGSGLPDHDYLRPGAELVSGPEEIFARADLIVKVKEPQPDEVKMSRKGQVLFTYFHLAADREAY